MNSMPNSPKPFILMVMAWVREEQLGPEILILNKQGDVGLSQSTGLHRSGRGPRNSQFFQTSRQNHSYWPALRCLDPEMFQVCLWARHNLLKWTLKSDTALVNGPQGQPTGTDLQRSNFCSIFLSFLPPFLPFLPSLVLVSVTDFVFVDFETGSHCSQAGLEFIMWPRLRCNSQQCCCLSLSSDSMVDHPLLRFLKN